MRASFKRNVMMLMNKPKNYHLLLWPALSVIFIDQVSKLVVMQYIPISQSVPILKGFFDLVHIRNRGIAFGIMNWSRFEFATYILILLNFAAIFLLIYWFFKLKAHENSIALGISLVLGGAFGNLIDRVRFREVVDFLDFYIGSYHWPAFNFADSAISISAIWIAANIIFTKK
jgi:signal peptidase II